MTGVEVVNAAVTAAPLETAFDAVLVLPQEAVTVTLSVTLGVAQSTMNVIAFVDAPDVIVPP